MAGYMVLGMVESDSGLREIRRGGDGVVYCQNVGGTGKICQGWLSKKHARDKRGGREPVACKHISAFVAETGTTLDLVEALKQAKAQAKAQAKQLPKVSPNVLAPIQLPAAKSKTKSPPVTQPVVDWKSFLRKEQEAAAARGVKTPAVALAAFEQEIGRAACIDLVDDEVLEATASSGRRSIDVVE